VCNTTIICCVVLWTPRRGGGATGLGSAVVVVREHETKRGVSARTEGRHDAARAFIGSFALSHHLTGIPRSLCDLDEHQDHYTTTAPLWPWRVWTLLGQLAYLESDQSFASVPRDPDKAGGFVKQVHRSDWHPLPHVNGTYAQMDTSIYPGYQYVRKGCW
jgi:hypothetical protein